MVGRLIFLRDRIGRAPRKGSPLPVQVAPIGLSQQGGWDVRDRRRGGRGCGGPSVRGAEGVRRSTDLSQKAVEGGAVARTELGEGGM